MTAQSTSRADTVAAAIDRLGGRVVIGTPIGVGKPVRLLNEIYHQARSDPGVSLTVVTGLTLTTPKPSSALAGRLLDPITERLSGGGPEPAWEADRASGRLPDNVEFRDFYLAPGRSTGVPAAQQSHVSANYHHVGDQIEDMGLNALAQLLSAPRGEEVSLGTNPDLSVQILGYLEARREEGDEVAIIGELAEEMPHLQGKALVAAERFDSLLPQEGPSPLFGIPNPPVGPTEAALGSLAAALVKDGGTLQLGIGALGDGVAAGIDLRHRDPGLFEEVVDALAVGGERALIEDLGGTGQFRSGLYAASEMLSDGLLALHYSGVVSRAVSEGVAMHTAFAAGSPEFYECLRRDARTLPLHMTDIAFTNTLLGPEQRKREQRRHARFINATMQATCLGEAASDTLDDGRVVSGVGGQHDFVTQAHDLDGGRSIIVARATRSEKGRVQSNVVWKHGHPTIPRHLRDIVVTEYGIADLRGKTDAEVIAGMVEIADSRFQDGLVENAKAATKLPEGYRVPQHARSNRPDRIADAMRSRPIPRYPFGSVLTDVEDELRQALEALDEIGWNPRSWPRPASIAASVGRLGRQRRRHLDRMGLRSPRGARERLMAIAVKMGLEQSGVTDE